MSQYTEQEIREMFFEALDAFNDCYESDITRENTVLAFFTPDNGLEVYEQLCRKYFPKHLSENYQAEGYFHSFAAQAFVSDAQYGIMVRPDLDYPREEYFQILLHEISHLYCTRNEIEGGRFFDRYCMGSGEEDGMMNAGYAIWREAVADIMADSILFEYTRWTLNDIKAEIKQLYNEMSPSNPDSKKCMSLIIGYIMDTKEVGGAESWPDAESQLKKRLGIQDHLLIAVIEMVFENLHRSPFWTITPEFIMDLGQTYLTMLTLKLFKTELDIS